MQGPLNLDCLRQIFYYLSLKKTLQCMRLCKATSTLFKNSSFGGTTVQLVIEPLVGNAWTIASCIHSTSISCVIVEAFLEQRRASDGIYLFSLNACGVHVERYRELCIIPPPPHLDLSKRALQGYDDGFVLHV